MIARTATLAALAAASVLGAPGAAFATETSTIALGDDFFFAMGVEMTLGQGTRPAFLPATSAGEHFRRLALGYRIRGGYVDEKTELGTQLGFEFDMFLGWTPRETLAVDPEDEVGFSLRCGLPLRVLTFAGPLPTALFVQLSAELEAGHARWWENTARLNLIGSLRLATRFSEDLDATLDYAAVPFVVTGSPHYIKYNRFEHRFMLSGGYGPLGLGVQLLVSHDLARASRLGRAFPTSDQALTFQVLYRIGG